MTNIQVIENKISSTRKYLSILEKYRSHSLSDIENDITLRGAMERYLYLAAQSTIDLAEAVISHKDLRKPSTYREAFTILEEAGLLSTEKADPLRDMVGFRNIIVHDYGEVDLEVVYNILQNRLSDVDKFLSAVEREFDL